MNLPIIMAEEYWANSQLSIARYYGQIKIQGKEYIIVNKKGQTVFETSIPPGETADLILKDWLPVYRKLGREKTIELVKNGVSLKDAKKIKKGDLK